MVGFAVCFGAWFFEESGIKHESKIQVFQNFVGNPLGGGYPFELVARLFGV